MVPGSTIRDVSTGHRIGRRQHYKRDGSTTRVALYAASIGQPVGIQGLNRRGTEHETQTQTRMFDRVLIRGQRFGGVGAEIVGRECEDRRRRSGKGAEIARR
eukprot:2386140-Rhodomonas_salina.2